MRARMIRFVVLFALFALALVPMAQAQVPLLQKGVDPGSAELVKPAPDRATIDDQARQAYPLEISNTIPNGDFELGHVAWTESSTGGWPLIYPEGEVGVPAHDGDWMAWLGGATEEISLLQQQVSVPGGSPSLEYWHWISSGHPCGLDVARVRINSTIVHQYDLCTATNTPGWVEQAVSLASYAGQTVMLGFEVQTTASTSSSLLLDDIEFEGTEHRLFLPLMRNGTASATLVLDNDLEPGSEVQTSAGS